MDTSFLPSVLQNDIAQAAQLIQQAYDPQSRLSSQDQRRLQQELFDIQKRPEAWGLVLPFLDHPDPNVQFFGAHTAQVKIARDWPTFPPENAQRLRDMLLELTGRLMASGRNKVILRKLFVAITSLALKLGTQTPSQWPDWLQSSVQTMSAFGASAESLLDYLAIVAEEIEGADLVGSHKAGMRRTLLDAVPMVTQAITTCTSRPRPHPSPQELRSALKCFGAWLPHLPANDITPFIPLLITLITPLQPPPHVEFEEDEFVLASDALQEILSRSALSDGAGTKTLTEPLLVWCERYGGAIVEQTISSGCADALSHSFCKLLTAIGDHSTQYLATNLASNVVPHLFHDRRGFPTPSKSQLVESFLKLLLAYTSLPGFYGVDEEESEMTLGFWYLFQEALWASSDHESEQENNNDVLEKREKEQWTVAKAVYTELVKVLGRKVVWPSTAVQQSWPKDQVDKFQAYRRDVGDTLINAYYVLRDDMLAFYVNDIVEKLAVKRDADGWEEIEGTFHCLMAVQEAVPVEDNVHLRRLFSPDVLNQLPSNGNDRIRRTVVILIGSYSSWFTTQPTYSPENAHHSLLMNAITYVVSALPDQSLCLHAANALRDLCDHNRVALAPHISAFGQLHANIANIPDTEKSKVLQSISSVIEALPPAEQIPPIEAILSPVVAKLFEALQSSNELPDEARSMAIEQLFIISGVAKGLTRTADSLLISDDSPDVKAQMEKMRLAREDPKTVRLREVILDALRRTADLWSTDASVCDALSDLFKAITALPSDLTLLSLSAEPLLEIICVASQRQLTAVWLSLATMLTIQLDPPTLLPPLFKTPPNTAAHGVVLNVLAVLLQAAMQLFSQPGAMQDNPDIVQAFFTCLDSIAQRFVPVFYQLPPDLFDALLQCAVGALSLQERYSLVSTCNFLATLINRTASNETLSDSKNLLIQAHGRSILRAVLSGFAGVAPRSATPNLIELLSTMVTKFPAESKTWMAEILYSPDFTPSQATPEAKDKFVKTMFSSKSLRRTRDAAQQFTLVARGLEGSSFGYATVSM
ncbi:ARM repeat-containing protein [Cristinia sonorae]|uniref:Importin-13 n=1 Tax=Cristinia sonorae TaxID=1940300 RepID=A0A8K0XJX7_9AGAR|nr:ARM repeat-containing protein [Cristinia sonorae]